MKLISMREFVLERENMLKQTPEEMERDLYIIAQYAHFLSQPLTLGMFVPCDDRGKILEEPMFDPSNEQYWASAQFEYERAKDRIIFEGFTVDEGMLKYNDRDTLFITRGNLVFYDGDDIYQLFTIEDIVFYGEDPELNQQAIKQIGG